MDYKNKKLRIVKKEKDGITIKENLIYIDLFETDENGTNAIYKQTYQKTPEMFEKPIVLDV